MQVSGVLTLLVVDSTENTLPFYRDLLGLTVKSQDGEYYELEGDISLCKRALYEQMFPVRLAESGGNAMIMLQCEHVDQLTQYLVDQGVQLLFEPKTYPWGERFAFVSDPEGNPVGIYGPA